MILCLLSRRWFIYVVESDLSIQKIVILPYIYLYLKDDPKRRGRKMARSVYFEVSTLPNSIG